MNDCPRHYTRKKAAYRSFSPDVRNKPFRRVSVCCVRFNHARRGVNALSCLQKHANSILCGDGAGQISGAHQAFLPVPSVSNPHRGVFFFGEQGK